MVRSHIGAFAAGGLGRRLSIALAPTAAFGLLWGCHSSQPRVVTPSPMVQKGPQTPRSPALLFATPAQHELLAQRGLNAGFDPEDWEYARRDHLMSLGPGPLTAPFETYFIFERETLMEFSGRPRTSGSRTVRRYLYGP